MWIIEPVGARTEPPPPLRGLWPGAIPRGSLTVLDGDPGTAKSLLTIDLAARLTRGGPWPDGSAADESSAAVLFCAEDQKARTVEPRLIAAGADLNRVYVFGTPDCPSGPVCLPRDLSQVADVLRLVRPGLVVFDPLALFLPAGGDGPAVRPVLTELVRLAARYGVAIVLLRHLLKASLARALYRGHGSIGIVGAARSGLLASADPANPDRFVLAPTKSNLGPMPPALAYRVRRDGAGSVQWLGPCPVTADEAVRGRPEAKSTRRGALSVADWLAWRLDAGPVPAGEVLARARAEGIGERTLNLAKGLVGVQSRLVYRNGGRRWEWSLPVRGDG